MQQSLINVLRKFLLTVKKEPSLSTSITNGCLVKPIIILNGQMNVRSLKIEN